MTLLRRRRPNSPALALTAVALAATVLVSPGPAGAQARLGSARSATVVEEVNRAPFGNMLATTGGMSLYILPTGSCTAGCLVIWPPLLMPTGTTKPLGIKGLGTAKFGQSRQVTYHKHRLYTFVSDSGSSVSGNGIDGFAVATVK